ncbi:hypothetical protein FXW07_07185 [Methanosarcina sp. DH1]|uniref:hypothetical protein n=1 Tax=Methanosarcina sp. DH1 TaxID=2605695 RepID=UPI001E3F1EBB|nr:hypothetical protein [Methanosarcina sp. DH1]MCC4766403.1 hypothetical protein [Methanosarcina sp. DH1]
MTLVKYADSRLLIDIEIANQLDQLAQERGHPKMRVFRDILCEALQLTPCQGFERSDGRQIGVQQTQKQINVALEQKAKKWGISKQEARRRVLKRHLKRHLKRTMTQGNFVDFGDILSSSAHTRLPISIAERIDRLARRRCETQAKVLRDILCECLDIPKCEGQVDTLGRQYGAATAKKRINAALERRAQAWQLSRPHAMLRILDQHFKVSAQKRPKKDVEQKTHNSCRFFDITLRLDEQAADIINQLAEVRGHAKSRVVRDTLCDALNISRARGEIYSNGQQHGTENVRKILDEALEQKSQEWKVSKQETIRRVLKEYFNVKIDVPHDNSIPKYYRVYLNGASALELSEMGLNQNDTEFVRRFHKEISSGAGLVRLSVSNPKKPLSLLKQMLSEWQQCEVIA